MSVITHGTLVITVEIASPGTPTVRSVSQAKDSAAVSGRPGNQLLNTSIQKTNQSWHDREHTARLPGHGRDHAEPVLPFF
jgi:hypothetical protein